MIDKLSKILKQRSPFPWAIANLDSASLEIRDTSIDRGKGYRIKIVETFALYQAIIEFEDFAKVLSHFADKRLSDGHHPIRKIFQSKGNIKLKRQRNTVEDALNSKIVFSDGWSLIFEYRKLQNILNNELCFSDLLLTILLFVLPYDLEIEEEGGISNSICTHYERSQINRSLCLSFHGYTCKACNLNLEEQYGDVARQFIHVHHLNPLSNGQIVKPDPIFDMVPLCPNCHSIAHLKNPPYTVEEITNMIIENNGKIFS